MDVFNMDLDLTTSITAKEPEKEKFFWVEGYKGTDKDMRCKDFQYSFGKVFVYEGPTRLCSNGFHFCEKLEDTLAYYPIGEGNRFFKVRGKISLDVNKVSATTSPLLPSFLDSKLVASEIEFLEEVDISSVIAKKYPELPPNYYSEAIEGNIYIAFKSYKVDKLTLIYGLSDEMADYLIPKFDWDFLMAIFSTYSKEKALDIILERDKEKEMLKLTQEINKNANSKSQTANKNFRF